MKKKINNNIIPAIVLLKLFSNLHIHIKLLFIKSALFVVYGSEFWHPRLGPRVEPVRAVPWLRLLPPAARAWTSSLRIHVSIQNIDKIYWLIDDLVENTFKIKWFVDCFLICGIWYTIII